MTDYHPFEPFIPANATKLIIGTIPPPRFCLPNPDLSENDVDFYYGSEDNNFWCLIGEVFETNFVKENIPEAITQRKDFLKKHNMGIADIIKSCKRKNNLAADDKIENPKYKEIDSVLLKNKKIDTLIYTSGFVKKCMHNIIKTSHSIKKENWRSQEVKISGKSYKVHILYSPSPQALRNMGKNGPGKILAQYKEVLCENQCFK